MPTGRFSLAAAEVNGKIYAIGDKGNTIEKYDYGGNPTLQCLLPSP